MFIKLGKMIIRPQSFKKKYSWNKKYWKTNKPQQARKTKKFWTKMETIVRKDIAYILKYMVVQQLGGGGVMLLFFPFFLLYVIIFYNSCDIISALKTDA